MGKIIQNGVIYTGTGSGGGGGASSVDQLTDVQLTNPTTGDELVYNSSLTSPYKWENKKLTWTGTQAQYDLIATPDPDVTYFITDSDTGNYGINDLADVNITSAANGQLLTYDSANSIWVNKKPNNLPIAYIRFSSTDSMSVWLNGETTYDTVTITDEYGSSLTPANLINSNKELIYDLQIEYIRLNSSDEIIARYVFRDINAQNLSGSSVFLISCNMIWDEMRAFVNFAYATAPTPRYTAKCYMFPITYDSKTAASSGTDLSLVTTGEKYNWDNKSATEISYSNTTSGLSATDVQSAIDEIDNSLVYETNDYSITTYGGIIRCKKWGRVVNIQGYSIGTSQTIPTGQAITLATIASKYRPNPQQHIMGTLNVGSYKYDNGQYYRINTDGTVVVYVYAGPTFVNGYFNVTYLV